MCAGEDELESWNRAKAEPEPARSALELEPETKHQATQALDRPRALDDWLTDRLKAERKFTVEFISPALASEGKCANNDLAEQMRQLRLELIRLNEGVEKLTRVERNPVDSPPLPQRRVN